MELSRPDDNADGRIPKKPRLVQTEDLDLDLLILMIWNGSSKIMELPLSMFRSQMYTSVSSYSYDKIQGYIRESLDANTTNLNCNDKLPLFVDNDPNTINNDMDLTKWLVNIKTNTDIVVYNGTYYTICINIQDPGQNSLATISGDIEMSISQREASDRDDPEELSVAVLPDYSQEMIDLNIDAAQGGIEVEGTPDQGPVGYDEQEGQQVERGSEQQGVTFEEITVSSQFDQNIWQGCCTLFNHDVRKMSNHDGDKCHLMGTNLSLYPYQLYSVYWMLTQPSRNSIYGGLIADDIGLGKTYQGMGFIAARSMILWCKEHVRAYPEDHLPLQLQETDQKCPQDYKFGIQCCCNKSSVAANIANFLHRGPVVVIAPEDVLHVWFDDLSKGLGLRQDGYKFDLHTMVSDGMIEEKFRQSALNEETIKGLRAKVKVYEEVTVPSGRPGTGDRYNNKFGLHSRKGQHSQIILLSNTMISTLSQVFQLDRRLLQNTTSIQLMPGTFLLDEIHIYRGSKASPGIAIDLMNYTARSENLPKQSDGKPVLCQPTAFAFSGTPAEKSPTDFYTLVDSLVRAGRALPNKPLPVSLNDIDELATTYDRLKRGENKPGEEQSNEEWCREVTEYQQKLADLTKGFVIRRSRIDKFGGNKICQEEPIIPTIFKFQVPDEYKGSIETYERMLAKQQQDELNKSLAKWDQTRQGPQPTMELIKERGLIAGQGAGLIRLLRIFSCFPAAARLHEEGGPLDLSAGTIQLVLNTVLRSADHAKGTEYYQNVDQLVEGSGKLKKLMETIEDMRAQRTPHQYDKETIPRNMVLFFSIPANLLIVYLYLLKHASDTVEIMHVAGGSDKRARAYTISKFREWQGTDRTDDKCKILLTSTQVSGVGASFGRANYCIAFDLPFILRDLAQSLARVSRAGQKEHTYLYVFIGTGCEGEESVLSRQEFRKLISGENKSIPL